MSGMTKSGAIDALIRASRSDRRSDAEARRILRACLALGITDSAERIRVFYLLDYCDETGGQYGDRIKRIW